jgi:hypothetical protein
MAKRKKEDTPTTVSRALVWSVRSFYDTQKLRLAVANRQPKKGAAPELQLDPVTLAFNRAQIKGLQALEKDAERHVAAVVKGHHMWPWLSDIIGVGPMISALCLVELNPYKAKHASSFKSFAGLGVVHALACSDCGATSKSDTDEVGDFCRECSPGRLMLKGSCQKPKKGQRLPYNKFLKTKMLGVLGTGIVKQALTKTELDATSATTPTRKRKGWVRWGVAPHATPLGSKKKAQQLLDEGKVGSGKTEIILRDDSEVVEDTIRAMDKDRNWVDKKVYYEVHPTMVWIPPGNGGRYIRIYLDTKKRLTESGWGNSNAHRNNAAIRKMIQQFLIDLWVEWRTQLGLPVSKPYEEAVKDPSWRKAHGYPPLRAGFSPFEKTNWVTLF